MRRERGRYVRESVPAVPTPARDLEALFASVAALKQAVEELLRRVNQLEQRLSSMSSP